MTRGKGFHHSEETKAKIGKSNSIANIGHTPWNKGLVGIMKPNSGSFKKGQYSWNKGRHLTEEQKIHLSQMNSKANTPIKIKIRNSNKYKIWRQEIFKRDKFECRLCRQHTKDLNAHHNITFSEIIESNNHKLLWDKTNVVTLCKSCHNSLHKILNYAKRDGIGGEIKWN